MASDQLTPTAWGPHGLGAEVLGHLRLHVPGLQQRHGHTAELFNVRAALNGPGLGFLLELAGKGAVWQENGKQVNKMLQSPTWGCWRIHAMPCF